MHLDNHPTLVVKWSMKALLSLSPANVAAASLVMITVFAPVILFPLSNSPIDASKMVLALLAVIVLPVVLAVHMIKQHTIRIPFHPLLVPALLFVVSGIISSVVSTPYPQTSFLGLQGMFVLSCLLWIFGGMVLQKKHASWLVTGLVGTTVFSIIWFVLQNINLGPSFIYQQLLGLPIQNNISFHPTGSLFVLAQLSFITLVALISRLTQPTKQRTLYIVATALVALGFLGTSWLSLPGKPTSPLILPVEAGWSVALDTLRVPKTALLGVGLSNYGEAFSAYKPAWLNTQQFWNVTYTQGSSFVFTLITGQGLLGLFVWLSLIFIVVKNYRTFSRGSVVLTHSFIAILVLQLLFPSSFLSLLLFGLVAAFLVGATKNQFTAFELQAWSFELVKNNEEIKPVKKYSKMLVWITSAIFLILSISLTFAGFKAFASERALFAAATAGSAGDIVKVYQLQQTAIQHNPYNDTLRRQYALTSIGIASALSNKSDISDQDRQQITELIQQAIREGQTATTLNPTRSQNWETLADIYANLIGTASEAETWAAQSYNQAIVTAPRNPLLFIKLGGVFYRQENYKDALLLFERAAQIKPNLANAYYNAANTLKKQGELATAENAYKQTLLLLEQEAGTASDEYVATSKELEELQTQIKAAEKQPAPTQNQATEPSANSGFVSDDVSLIQESVDNLTRTPDNSDSLPLN